MSKSVGLVLALGAVFGLGALSALAKGGGGHGGGHHGGGHHHSHHSQHHSHHGHHSHHHVSHHGHHHAYSHDWHRHHPGAWGWGAGGYLWGNPWAVASYGAAASWLGVPAVVNNDVTVDSEASTPAPETVNNDTIADDGQEATQPADAAALAESGAAFPDPTTKFLPLGVFTLAPKGTKGAVALVHLAVSKDGFVRGSYYSLKTNKATDIQGAVSKTDQSLAWTLGPKGQQVFHASLMDVTNPPGPVTVRGADGQTHVWTMARFTEKDEGRSFDEAQQRSKQESGPGQAASNP